MLRYAIAVSTLTLALSPAPLPTAAVPLVTYPVGDVTTADRIIVYVPGVGTEPGDLARPARALHAATGVPVVAWLGYHPPDGLGPETARDRRARAGAVSLVEYVDSLPPTASVTLVGHSYGALVIGFAAPELPATVTDLVALGAPGMGADRVADLHTHAQVWAAEAPDDWIRWVPPVHLLGLGHGIHPADPAFGAHALPTRAGIGGHDGYLATDSPTLAALAAITAAAS